jgi:hypothetical protein
MPPRPKREDQPTLVAGLCHAAAAADDHAARVYRTITAVRAVGPGEPPRRI